MLYLRVGIGKIEFLAVLFSLRLKTLQKPPFGLIYLNYALKKQVFWNFFLKTLASNQFLLYLCIRFRERTKPQAKRVKFVLRLH